MVFVLRRFAFDRQIQYELHTMKCHTYLSPWNVYCVVCTPSLNFIAHTNIQSIFYIP